MENEIKEEATTETVCNEIIKRVTGQNKGSFCQFLQTDNQNPNVVGAATHFISHAWKNKFLEVVQALKTHFQDHYNEKEIFIWFDIFCVDQHTETQVSIPGTAVPDWQINFRKVVSTIRHTVLVLSPWKDPIALKRSWCLHEIFTTQTVPGSKLEIAMNLDQKHLFHEEMNKSGRQGTLEKLVSRIDLKKSKSTNRLDRKNIIKA